MAKQDDYVRYTIRVPAELYDEIKATAGEKSVNAEIVSRLYASQNAEPEKKFLDMLIGREFTKVLPKGLAGRIQARAEEHNRPVQEEVVQALETLFPPPPTTEELIESLSTLFKNIDLRARGINPYATRDPKFDEIILENARLHLEFLKGEHEAGRSANASGRFHALFEHDADGRLVRKADQQ